MQLFGGYGSDWLIDCYEFNLNSEKWKHIPDNEYQGRLQPAGAYRKSADSVIYYGGYTGKTLLNELLEYSFVTKQWIEHPNVNGPPPCHTCCVLAPDATQIFVHGGIAKSKPVHTLHSYSFVTRTWTKLETTMSPNMLLFIKPKTMLIISLQDSEYKSMEIDVHVEVSRLWKIVGEQKLTDVVIWTDS